MSLASWAQASTCGQPFAPIRSRSVSPTVMQDGVGAGQRKYGASSSRGATRTKRGRSWGTPKSEACSRRQSPT